MFLQLVSLKAELSRKQQEVSQAKAHGQLVRPVKEKKPTIWSKQNVGVSQRDERDAEQIQEEKDALKNSKYEQSFNTFFEVLLIADFILQFLEQSLAVMYIIIFIFFTIS